MHTGLSVVYSLQNLIKFLLQYFDAGCRRIYMPHSASSFWYKKRGITLYLWGSVDPIIEIAIPDFQHSGDIHWTSESIEQLAEFIGCLSKFQAQTTTSI